MAETVRSAGLKMSVVRTVTVTEAKARLGALLSEVERTGDSVTVTNHGRPVAVLSPVSTQARVFGQLPNLVVPDTFDDPLPAEEVSIWESKS